MLIQGWGACGIDIKVLYMLHGNYNPQVDTLSSVWFCSENKHAHHAVTCMMRMFAFTIR